MPAKRIEKSSKDFAQLIGKTSEQYSRIENGAVLTASNGKLVRLMVIAMSVIGALKEPALMERVANQTWDTGIGRSGESSPVSTQHVSGLWKRKLLSPLHPTSQNRDMGHPLWRRLADVGHPPGRALPDTHISEARYGAPGREFLGCPIYR